MDPVYLLLRTLECECRPEPSDAWSGRIELYQSLSDATSFRCRIWEYRPVAGLIPVEPGGPQAGELVPTFYLVDWTTNLVEELEHFTAPTAADALVMVVRALGLTECTLQDEDPRCGFVQRGA